MRRTFPLSCLVLLVLALVVGAAPSPAGAAPALSVTPITWNVIGLDSNDVTSGPNEFPVGARVCNSGSDPATGVAVTFAWTSANAAMDVGGPTTVAIGTLGVGACDDTYWLVAVDRSTSSYDAARSYVITVTSAEGVTAATPSPREIYVERLISQNRNSVNSVTGPSAVAVGDTVTYTVDANTATNGYEQLESFLTLPSNMFELVATTVTYSAPAGATNDTMYADACGWDNVPTSLTYRDCIGPTTYAGGKVGGALVATYTVRIVGAGTATLSAAIYDQSGSSYHYNSDFGASPNLLIVTASQPVPTTTTTTTTTTTVDPTATTTTTDPTATAGATGSRLSPTAPAGTVAGPSATATAATATAPGTAAPRSNLATTGRSGPLSLAALGLALLVVGSATTAGARRLPTTVPATALALRVHQLRATLYEHEGDPVAARAWPLLDALDAVNRDL